MSSRPSPDCIYLIINALIADYCYNKEIHVDSTNVIYVKCAEMNSNGKGGLCMFVDNILFDLLYVAKSKRDFKLILQLLKESFKYKEIAEALSALRTSKIDPFQKSKFVP